jgi:hypothetical protein
MAFWAALPWLAKALILTAASWAVSKLTTKTPDLSSLDDAQGKNVRANTKSTQEPVKVVYGTRLVGGNDVFMETTGIANKTLWVVQSIGEGECDSVLNYYVDGKDPSEFGGNITTYFVPGTSTQSYGATSGLSHLNTAFPAKAIDNYRNTALIIWKLNYDIRYFNSFPQRTVELKGRKLYDFRDATTAWSDNPVLCMYDYLTNTRYGLGKSASLVDADSWEIAADYCDTKGWSFNHAFLADDPAQDILSFMANHFRGELVWFDGKYYLRFADLNEESSVMAITDDHIVQGENGLPAISISQPSTFGKPDAVRVKWTDADREYVTDDFMIGDSLGVVEEVDLQGCLDRQQAADLGVYRLERAILDRTISVTCRDDCLQLDPHDLITLTTTALSISNQLMRVVDASIQPNGLVSLTLIYENTDLYDSVYNVTTAGTYSCTLPDKDAPIEPVGAVSVTEETYNYRLRTFTRLKIAFDEPATYPWYSHIEVWVSEDNSVWKHQFDTTNDFNLDNIEEGVIIWVRLKTVNIWGAKSADGDDYKISHVVGGYSSAPTSLSSLEVITNANAVNLYSYKVSDPDVELYEFRLGDSWSGAIFLAALRSPNMSLFGVKPGTHTFYANTLANNLQYGDTPVSATATVVEPPQGWTIAGGDTQTCDYNGVGTHAGTEYYLYGADDTVRVARTGLAGADSDMSGANSWVQGTMGTLDINTTVAGKMYILGDNGGNDYVYIPSKLVVGNMYYVTVKARLNAGSSTKLGVGTRLSGATEDNYWFGITPTGTEDTYEGTFVADQTSLFIGALDDTLNGVAFEIDDVTLVPVAATLTGTYTSPVYDLTTSTNRLVYCLADIVVTGGGTTWADQFPSPNTWADGNVTTREWREIFELNEAPSVAMRLNYGVSAVTESTVEKMELCTTEVTGRYFQVEIEITDPSAEVYVLVKDFTLKFCT